jgi:hypothetical protein
MQPLPGKASNRHHSPGGSVPASRSGPTPQAHHMQPLPGKASNRHHSPGGSVPASRSGPTPQATRNCRRRFKLCLKSRRAQAVSRQSVARDWRRPPPHDSDNMVPADAALSVKGRHRPTQVGHRVCFVGGRLIGRRAVTDPKGTFAYMLMVTAARWVSHSQASLRRLYCELVMVGYGPLRMGLSSCTPWK